MLERDQADSLAVRNKAYERSPVLARLHIERHCQHVTGAVEDDQGPAGGDNSNVGRPPGGTAAPGEGARLRQRRGDPAEDVQDYDALGMGRLQAVRVLRGECAPAAPAEPGALRLQQRGGRRQGGGSDPLQGVRHLPIEVEQIRVAAHHHVTCIRRVRAVGYDLIGRRRNGMRGADGRRHGLQEPRHQEAKVSPEGIADHAGHDAWQHQVHAPETSCHGQDRDDAADVGGGSDRQGLGAESQQAARPELDQAVDQQEHEHEQQQQAAHITELAQGLEIAARADDGEEEVSRVNAQHPRTAQSMHRGNLRQDQCETRQNQDRRHGQAPLRRPRGQLLREPERAECQCEQRGQSRHGHPTCVVGLLPDGDSLSGPGAVQSLQQARQDHERGDPERADDTVDDVDGGHERRLLDHAEVERHGREIGRAADVGGRVHAADRCRVLAQPARRSSDPERCRDTDQGAEGSDPEGQEHRQTGSFQRGQTRVEQQQEDRDRSADADQVPVQRGTLGDRRDEPKVRHQQAEQE